MSDSVAEIEALIGRRLPEDLHAYFLGDFRALNLPAEIDVPDSSPWTDEVEQLFEAGDALGILQEDQESVENGVRHVPAGTVPIGDNDNGDFYAVSVRDADFGSVYYLFHETSDPLDESLEGAYLLAPSLSNWVDSFRPGRSRDSIPDWEANREAERQKILNPPKRVWWKFWE